MYCPQCGTANPDNDRFCRNCGTPLTQAPPAPPAYAPPPPPPSYNQPAAYNQNPSYPPPPAYNQPPAYGAPPYYGAPGYQAEASSQSRIMAVLAYLLPFIGPVIAIATAKGDKFARFHGWQAGLYNAVWVALWILSLVLAMLSETFAWLFWLLYAGLGIMALIAFIQAIMGKMFKIPLIGQFADRLSG